MSPPVLQDLAQCVTCQEKHITVKKAPSESLGMTVAGGRGGRSGELPIFVTSVPPHGCLARDGRIKRGKGPRTAVPPNRGGRGGVAGDGAGPRGWGRCGSGPVACAAAAPLSATAGGPLRANCRP